MILSIYIWSALGIARDILTKAPRHGYVGSLAIENGLTSSHVSSKER